VCVYVCLYVYVYSGRPSPVTFVDVEKQTASSHSGLLEAQHARKCVRLEIPQ
jgi:hypothetical protein